MSEEEHIRDGTEEVYDDEGREDMVKNDEISPEEEAFMQGYEDTQEKEEKVSGEEEYEAAFESTGSKKKKK